VISCRVPGEKASSQHLSNITQALIARPDKKKERSILSGSLW
jgi:hypothetical protein